MGNNLMYAAIFIFNTLFNFYIMILMARILLQMSRANPSNPITQFIITVTKWPVGLCQRFLPTIKNIDFAILFVMIMTILLKIVLIVFLTYDIILTNILGLLVWAFGEMTVQFINLMFYAILIQVIASWIATSYTPVMEVIHYITAPILKPCQRIIPSIGGLDISPVLAILLLKAFEMTISWNIVNLGKALSTS